MSTKKALAQTTAEPDNTEEMLDDAYLELSQIFDRIADATENLARQFLSHEGLFQLAVIVLAGTIAFFASKAVRNLLMRIWPTTDGENRFRSGLFQLASRLVLPSLWVIGLWIGSASLREFGIGNDFVRILASLLNAWIVIRLFSATVRDPLWSKTFATVAWTVAALNILRLLDPTINLLDAVAISLGGTRLSLYMIIKGLLVLILLLWLAAAISSFVQTRVAKAAGLTPSVQTLIGQSVRVVLLFLAILLAMNAIGVDLTALAVFSGAVGVGIGFGLQAIFSNLVAGIIMLLEGSIKVGDFVELESGVTGEVREINIRSTRVTTNDNVDILVPNAEFINKQVTNWTLREGFRRTRIPFSVAYGTDKELVRKVVLEAASEVPHMLKGAGAKDPTVWLSGFGESSLDFELVVWLSPEAVKRPSAVAADYNWAIETALTKNGIEIPFPQRDLHIRSGELPIKLTAEKGRGK